MKILNSKSNTVIAGSTGADSITNYGTNVTIDAGNGNDEVTNVVDANNVLINAGNGNDTVWNLGNYVTITGGAGKDILVNSASNVTLDGGSGNDEIANFNANRVSMNGGDGNDTLENDGTNVTMLGGNGKDTLINEGANVLMDGGADNDFIQNASEASYATIRGGAGNDTVINEGVYTMVDGGDGNNIIENHGVRALLTSGDGSDSITNTATRTYIYSGGGNDTIVNRGDNTSIRGGDGDDIILDFADNVTIDGGTGNDSVMFNNSNVEINGGLGADYIVANSVSSYVTINGELGNDYIENRGSIVAIDGGDGADTILNYGNRATITGGRGNDFIANFGANVTINGAAGDDSVYNEGAKVSIGGGAGNDYLENVGSVVAIDGGAGNDFINNAGKKVTIIGGEGEDTINLLNSVALIKYFAGDGTDYIYGADASTTVTLSADTHYTSVANGLDLILSVGVDSLVLIDSVGRGVKIKGGVVENVIENSVAGASVTGTAAGDVIKNYGAKATINAGNGNDTVYNYAKSVKIFGGAGTDYIYNEGGASVTIDGGAGNDHIVNSGARVSIFGGAGNDFIYLDASKTKVTVNGGTGNDTIEGGGTSRVYQYKSGDGNDVIRNYADSDTISITDGAVYQITTSGADAVVSIGSGSIVVKNYAEKHVNISKGMRQLNGTDDADLFTLAATDGNHIIKNFGARDTLQITSGSITSHYASGNDYIVAVGSARVTLEGAAGYGFNRSGKFLTVDSIVSIPSSYTSKSNSSSKVNVTGTAGNDYIINSGENVTIQGNGGDDIIEGSDFGEVYLFGAADGHDSIFNFGDNDTIQITNGEISSVGTVGNDFVINVEGTSSVGTITLKDAADKNFSFNDSKVTIVDGVNYIVNNNNKVRLGTSLNDYIINSGQNVTIRAGAGNDTIEGSTFGEQFWVSASDGKNTVTNFGRNDSIRITDGSSVSTQISGADYIITLKGSSSRTAVYTLLNAAEIKFKRRGATITADADNEIFAFDDFQKVNGTGDNDYIINTVFEGVTIQPNEGNDTIEGSDFGEMFVFGANDGNNLILNFDENDTLQAIFGSIAAVADFGDYHIVTIQDEDHSAAVTLQNTGALNLIQNAQYVIADAIHTIKNSTAKKLVEGTAGRDYITNSGSNVTIQSGAGRDTIVGSKYGEMFLFSASDGLNVITNFDKLDTLRAVDSSIKKVSKVGNNYVVTLQKDNYSGTITLQGASDLTLTYDTKTLTVDYVNEIVNNKNQTVVAGTSGSDYIKNNGQNVTIQSGAGKDTITGSDFGEVFSFNPASGANTITNFGLNDTIFSSSGSIASYKSVGSDVVVTIKSGSTKSTVRLLDAAEYVGSFKKSKQYLTIDHADTIINTADKKKVVGTSGNDVIINYGAKVTISAGAGNDTVTGSDAYGDQFWFAHNTGNNVVTNFGANDTLRCTAGSISAIKTVGNNTVVTLKSGTSKGTVTLLNTGKYKFKQNGKYLIVDSVPTISSARNNTLISGGDGADYIVNSGFNVTINGAGGNDTIEGADFGETFLFAATGGRDVIKNFGANDTLKVIEGLIQSHGKVGNDYVMTVKDSRYTGAVTLQGAGGYSFIESDGILTVDGVTNIVNQKNKVKVVGTSGKDWITNTGANVTIQAKGGNDTITGSNYAETYLFAYGSGNNVITNFGTNDTIKSTSGTITGAKKGDNYVVTIKSGSSKSTVTLQGAGDYIFKNTGKTLYVTGVSSAQLPADDYWFTSNESAPIDEIDVMMKETPLNNSIGELTVNTVESGDKFNVVINDEVFLSNTTNAVERDALRR